jgi:hypothetical protein
MFYGYENTRRIIAEIKSTMTHHPVYEPLAHETQCLVLDDDQWNIYKKHLARIAKERSAKKKPINNAKKRKVRDRRDMEIEAIEIVQGKIIRICDTTFCVTKFNTIDEVTTDKTYRSHVCQALRGDIGSFGGYFWIQ